MRPFRSPSLRAVAAHSPSSSSDRGRVTHCVAWFVLLFAAQPCAARVFQVSVPPPVWQRAASVAAAAPGKPGVVAPLVLPVLLGPGEDVVAVHAPWPVTCLGTGDSNGYAIAALALGTATLPAGSTLSFEVETRPGTRRVAGLRRPDALRSLDARRTVASLVVNPAALGLYAEPLLESKPAAAGGFQPSATPSLEGSPVQMLILTRDALVPTFQAYADYRTGLGIPTVVRSVEWIAANAPHGADLAETLRDFVRDAYELWGIRSLLLGGDTDLVPTRYASSVYTLEGESVPTDLYFACLDGNWNADRDARWGEGYNPSDNSSDMADLYPELWVGRLPVVTPDNVTTLLGKLHTYLEPSILDYQNKMLFLAEVIWPASYKQGDPILKNGSDNAERLIGLNQLVQPGRTLTRLYETPDYYPGSEQLSRAAAIGGMETGYGLVTDIGHGFRYTMSLGDASLTNVQALLLANAARPFFLSMLNCSAGAFDFPCLAEKFLLNAGGGAIGVIGSAREAYPDNIQLFQEAWFGKVYLEGYTRAAEALHEARLRYVAQTYDDGAYRWSNFITSYLGDPELVLWAGAPRVASVVHAASMPLGTRSFAVTVTAAGVPVPGATVCLWKSGDFYAVARTNLAGIANLSFVDETTGTAQLSVSGGGVLPYRANVPVTGLVGVSLRATGAMQVQDSGAGTNGNGNGVLEASETALVRFEVENQGTTMADLVTLQTNASDPALLLGGGAVSVGAVPPGARLWSSPVTMTIAGNVLDQSHVPVDVVLRTGQGWSWSDRVWLDLLQVMPAVQRLWVDDKTLGNGDGVPQANENYDLKVDLKNYGFATLQGATGQLVSTDPDVVIQNATTTFGNIGHLTAGTGTFRLRETNVAQSNRMTLLVFNSAGRSWSFGLEVRRPLTPTALLGDPSDGTGRVRLEWTPSPTGDVAGYVVYRATKDIGPWNRASFDLVRNTSSFLDDGLQSGGRYYYAVSAVDSSGNESARTPTLDITTNPGQLAGWPQQLGLWSNSSPVVADLDGDLKPEIVVGASDHLYAWKASGAEVKDGDATPGTRGVFSSIAANFMPGLAAADLDHDGKDEIVACTFDTKQVYVFQGDGSIRAGWPRSIVTTATPGVWATPAIGDLDLDGNYEIVVLGLDGRLYAWHANGTEVRDGDANPSTQGVFFVIPPTATWSRGAPAIANVLPDDATPEIVFGTENNKVYVLRANGTVATGWPRTVGDHVNSAPSIGDIDGDGALEIAVPARDGQLYVFRRDGTNQPGWPRPLQNQWNALTPSVALADFDGDHKLELVAASTGGTASDGSLTVFDWQGNVRSGWPRNIESASEASPIVGDLDGDGTPEILFGGESGILHGFRPNGTTFPGFPIRVGAEVRATPMITDADSDGHVDVLFSGWDQQVYIWKFAGLYVRRHIPWGAFKNNALRNSVYEFREPTDAGETPGVPRRTALYANVPNPFNPITVLRFDIGGTGPQRVRLQVFDARGRRVRALVDRDLAPGTYSERWDGRDDAGRPMASGVYFYRLDSTNQRDTRKMVLVR